MKPASAIKSTNSVAALCLIAGALLACQFPSLKDKRINLFEQTNAQQAAAKIKEKIGLDPVKISRIEIRQDQMEMVVQDPNKPKNFDKYTYSNGAVSGPEPVESMVFGNTELTADKMPLFSLADINLAATSKVCQNAVERAQIEDGQPDLITIDWEYAGQTQSKAQRETGYDRDLVVTWRIWVKSPRMTKSFYADAQGNLAE
jgi:hypothetical protein